MRKIAVQVLGLLVGVAGLFLPLAYSANPYVGVIYGGDNRMDVVEARNSKFRRWADSTVALFQEDRVESDGQGAMKLLTQPYGSSHDLCSTERFFDQPSGAFCSGSLVAKDMIMTAGHCVTSQESCQATKFVFGFALGKKNTVSQTIDASEVYGCAELIAREQSADGGDWALVRLDRLVTGHRVLDIDRSGSFFRKYPREGAPMVVIGHPSGLPTKIADAAFVRDSSNPEYFVANLDTYGGNSGSAVLDPYTGLIEGILVRGDTDFIYEGNCRVSKVCADDKCRGEDVTKVRLPGQYIPLIDRNMLVPDILGVPQLPWKMSTDRGLSVLGASSPFGILEPSTQGIAQKYQWSEVFAVHP